MAAHRINILIYSGTGASPQSVRQTLYSLRRILSPNYSVSTINAETIIKEPWGPTCSLIVFPGGGDLGYCRSLNGAGNRKVRQFVHMGGSYLGFCAGGYYGSARCEFEAGDDSLEVVGPRELELFPGTCRGSAFKGFQYDSEIGARAAELRVNKSAFPSSGVLPESFKTYFNGGAVFVDAPKYADRGVEVLADYSEELDVDSGTGSAAVVFCKLGEGNAILTGPHPEFAAANISKNANGMDGNVVDDLRKHDRSRLAFTKACLTKLGLTVNSQHDHDVPSLSTISISSSVPEKVEKVVKSLEDISAVHNGEIYLKGDTDFFQLQIASDSKWSMTNLTKAALEILIGTPKDDGNAVKQPRFEQPPEQDQVIKTLVAHTAGLPEDTPFFSHDAYFNALRYYNDRCDGPTRTKLGDLLMYGEVVSSTSTLLEKLTSLLPIGTCLTATTQLSGRGRGSNAWISPAGSLMFSFVIRHPLTLNLKAPVVFIQYLAAIAIAEAVRAYQPSASSASSPPTNNSNTSPYDRMPVHLKWPNDVYTLDPSHPSFHAALQSSDPAEKRKACVKVGGILVNSSYSGGDYTLIVGIGLNVSNAAPTTSLNAVLTALNTASNTRAEPYTLENLLPSVLAHFGRLYDTFCTAGFAGGIEQTYYKYWLHADQAVTLENEGGVKARVMGITTDWGLLRAQVEGEQREVGCQADGNSFDFFKGLIKRKI